MAQQFRVLRRVVLQISILNNDVVGRRLGKAATQCGTSALIAALMEYPHPRVINQRENVTGAIGGGIVDDNDLDDFRSLQHRGEAFADRGLLVEDRHHNRQAGVELNRGGFRSVTLAVHPLALPNIRRHDVLSVHG